MSVVSVDGGASLGVCGLLSKKITGTGGERELRGTAVYIRVLQLIHAPVRSSQEHALLACVRRGKKPYHQRRRAVLETETPVRDTAGHSQTVPPRALRKGELPARTKRPLGFSAACGALLSRQDRMALGRKLVDASNAGFSCHLTPRPGLVVGELLYTQE